MAEKTTVYLGPEYRRLKEIARRTGRPAAQLIRDAVAEYVQRHGPRERPLSIGAGSSGMGDLAERAEELLDGFGEDE